MPFLKISRLSRLLLNAARVAGAALALLLSLFMTVSHLFAAPSLQSAPGCEELIVNGGFEQTAVGWSTMPQSALFTYANDSYVGGRRSLLLGFTVPLNIPVSFGVEQYLTLPADSSTIEFSFYYDIEVEGEASPGDQAYLTIHDAANSQLLAMLVLYPLSDNPTSGAASTAGWRMGRYDLTPLAGKNIWLTFATQNDGEPGRLAMRVDDVSILACLPPEAFALQPLPTPVLETGAVTPDPMVLVPPTIPPAGSPDAPPSGAVTVTIPLPEATPTPPQVQSAFPQPGSITSLDACSCTSSLYTCSDFANWAIAQACYTYCQVNAGYDIHNLDEDRNGIACELELQDVAPLDATPSPQPTPSPVTATTELTPEVTPVITANASVTAAVATPVDAAPVPAGDASDTAPDPPPLSSQNALSAVTTTIATSGTDTITGTASVTAAVAAPVPPVEGAATPVALPPDEASSNPAAALSPVQLLSLLIFSPLGYILIGALLVIGSLSLWGAYMLGQREQREKMPTTRPPAARPAANHDIPEEFILESEREASASKS